MQSQGVVGAFQSIHKRPCCKDLIVCCRGPALLGELWVNTTLPSSWTSTALFPEWNNSLSVLGLVPWPSDTDVALDSKWNWHRAAVGQSDLTKGGVGPRPVLLERAHYAISRV